MQVEKIFLTQSPHEDSAISWYVDSKNVGESWQGESYIESDVKISDCSRTITIEMGCDAKDYVNKRKKIRALIDSLIRYENALLTEMQKEVNDE